MKRWTCVAGAAGALGIAAIVVARPASACGGCFVPPTPPNQVASDITDERMLLSVSPTQSTLYDQIRYSGAPASFAWVLPIHGTVDVGLSADVLFDSIDALTATTIIPPVQNCPPATVPGGGGRAASGSTGTSSGADLVTVTKQENVGPYATVQLHSTDASALNDWLAQNGFDIPTDVTPVIDQYVSEGADFLAMKLLPGQGVQSMRPVRVTTPGASLTLPLRMAAVGTGPIVGITIWVVADGRYEPQNFPFYRIDDTQLVWDFAISASNYTTLRVQNEAQSSNKAWEIESSITLNEQVITNAIVSGGQVYANGLTTTATSDPALDYLPVGTPPDAGGDAGSDGGYQSADEVRAADISTMFVGLAGPNVRVTRIRSDIAHAWMTADLVLQASGDQSDLSNVRNVTNAINNRCPIYGATAAISSSVGTGGGGYAFSSNASGSTGNSRTASTSASTGNSAAPSRGGSGCSCRTTPSSGAGSMAAVAGLGVGLGLVTRRRRTRRDRGA